MADLPTEQPQSIVSEAPAGPAETSALPESWRLSAAPVTPEATEATGETNNHAGVVPETADKYEATLPPDFELPDGWTIDAEAPLWKHGKEFAKANGLTQEQFSGLAKLYVEGQIAEKALSDAELAGQLEALDKALGPHAAARKETLNKGFVALFGEHVAQQLAASLFTPDIVGAWEKVLGLAKQAAISPSTAQPQIVGRSDGRPGNWDRMSALDRRTWHLEQQQRR